MSEQKKSCSWVGVVEAQLRRELFGGEPVLPTSRSYADDLHELWAGGQTDGHYDATKFRLAFAHLGRRIVLASLTDVELAALGIRIMVSTDTEPPHA